MNFSCWYFLSFLFGFSSEKSFESVFRGSFEITWIRVHCTIYIVENILFMWSMNHCFQLCIICIDLWECVHTLLTFLFLQNTLNFFSLSIEHFGCLCLRPRIISIHNNFDLYVGLVRHYMGVKGMVKIDKQYSIPNISQRFVFIATVFYYSN